ncbi:helicase, partial [Kineococcus glutinatus]|uniref:HelD family protein n=1 Tax=Kineococcus glutinatus TaxID=1070872 RepID=UPI0031E98B9A
MNSVDEEQRFLEVFHAARGAAATAAAERLRQVLRQPARAGQAQVQREAQAAALRRRLTALDAAGEGLCFGRLDRTGGDVLHVGRVALSDREQRPLLIDWRAPAARPFYTATAHHPDGVRRRRHISTRGQRVVAVQDEHLTDPAHRPGTAGHDADGRPVPSALLSALEVPRTGVVRDIVSTIQAEQDLIIRQPLHGVLVVQGGPGTGKTAVALHRTAYLLYTHRERLEGRGVLLVGPNRTFVDHVGQVLPALGENAVVMATPGRLFPGVDTDLDDPPRTAQVKGRPDMADVVAAAVRDRQEVPPQPVEVDLAGFTLAVSPHLCAGARERARASGLPHNPARSAFAAELVEAVTAEYARQLGDDPYGGPDLLDEDDLPELRTEVREAPDVHELIERCWPALTPQRLLRELFSSPERLRRAAADLHPEDRALLLRGPGGTFTVSDVPLLDEAAELLGERPAAHHGHAGRRRRSAYARGVLEVLHGSRPTDLEDDQEPEVLTATDLLAGEALAELLTERYEPGDERSTAERAAADRTWAYGHVVVDEAQELPPMTWRLLARRCPTRSMTVVGDLHQASVPGAPTDWAQVRGWLGAGPGDRQWRVRELNTSYRTPERILAVAAGV